MTRVGAVVVTYNRRQLLRETLEALAAQSRPLDDILVVDNASTDGTPEMLHAEFPAVEKLRLPTNTGGAGGFHHGLEAMAARDVDWVWVMDDDSVATPTALAELLAAEERVLAAGLAPPTILASRVLWIDGRPHPMNEPGGRPSAAVPRELDVTPIRFSSFVAPLIRRDALDRHGLPLHEYFLWLDDVEFTARVLRREPGYLVERSIVHHETADPYVPVESADRFYFAVRNRLFMIRGEAFDGRERLAEVRDLVYATKEFLQRHRGSRTAMRAVARGLRDGLGRLPVPRAVPDRAPAP